MVEKVVLNRRSNYIYAGKCLGEVLVLEYYVQYNDSAAPQKSFLRAVSPL